MTNRNKIVLATLGLLVLVISGRVWFGFRSQPQLPPRDDVFRTVDALFTAVTARDERRLAACEKRLSKYTEAGELPAGASKRLRSVIATARSGQWEPAAHRLYDFMQGQRRDSVPERRSQQTAMNLKSAG